MIGSGAGSAAQHRIDPRRSVPLTLSVASTRETLRLVMRGSKAADAVLDELTQRPSRRRCSLKAPDGEVGQSVANQRALELRQARFPRSPPPTRVQQLLEVAAHAGAQLLHRGRDRERACPRVAAGSASISSSSSGSCARRTRPRGPCCRRARVPDCRSCRRLQLDDRLISSQVCASSPTSRVTAPTPRDRPVVAGLSPVGCPAELQGVGRGLRLVRPGRIENRQIDVTFGAADHPAMVARRQKRSRGRFIGCSSSEASLVGCDPEILARRRDDLEARCQEIVGVAHVVEGNARSVPAGWGRACSASAASVADCCEVAAAQRHHRRQAQLLRFAEARR